MQVIIDSDSNQREKGIAPIKKSGNIAFTGIECKESVLYKSLILRKTEHRGMISINSEKEKLSHNRLGHSGIELINKTIPIVNGIGLNKIYKLEKFTFCLKRKSHRSHSPKQSQE